MTTASFLRRLGLLVTLGLTSGCVAQDAGYQDVRTVVNRRSGHDVRWQHIDGDGASQKALRELLSKPLNAEAAVKVALLNSAETRRQQQLLKARAAQVRAAARSAAARLTAARDRALLLKNVLLPSRERLLQETQLHYNAMSVSVFQLLLARRDQIETARAYVDALRDY